MEGIRATACQDAEMQIERQHRDGDIDDAEARTALTCLRGACDAIHERIVGEEE